MGEVVPIPIERGGVLREAPQIDFFNQMAKLMSASERATLEMMLLPFIMRQKHAGEVKSYRFEDLSVGQSTYDERVVGPLDRDLAALLSKDYNPIHFSEEEAAKTRFEKPIVHGLVIQGIFSALLGTKLPGKGTIYMESGGFFKRPVYFGDSIRSEIQIVGLNPVSRTIELNGTARKYNEGVEQVVYQHKAKVMLDRLQG